MTPHPSPKRSARAVLCGALLLLSACGRAPVQVIEVPTEKEANEILVLLDRYGVSEAQKEAVTAQRKTVWRVTTDPGHGRAARFVLDRLGLPREDRGGLESALESGGVIPSAQTEHARLIHAKSDKLARTLESHERILTARVHIVLPEEEMVPRDGALAEALRPTASVFLSYLPARKGAAPAEVHEAPRAPLSARGLAPEDLQAELRDLAGLAPEAFARLANAPADRVPDLCRELDLRDDEALREVLALYGGSEPASDPDWPLSRAEVAGLVSKAVEGLRPWDVEVIYSAVELTDAAPGEGGVRKSSEVQAFVDEDAARLARLEQLDRPFALVAGLLALLSGFLFFLLRRERARTRGIGLEE